MSKITFVTDKGTNMISALRNFNRFNCCAHLINTVLRNIFDSSFLTHQNEDGYIPLQPVVILMTVYKQLAKFMKSSRKNSLLTIGLVKEVETRWNTRLLMLQSVEKALPEIFEVFGENFGRIQNINVELLKTIIEFLKPFKTASDKLEGDNYSIIHKSVLYKISLQNHLKYFINLEENIINDDGELSISSILCKIALRALDFINIKFILSEEHEMAVFLWSKFKNLKMFPLLSDRHRINVNIETKLLHIKTQHNVDNYDTINDVQYSTIPSPTIFSEWEDNENDIPSRNNNNKYKIELNSYKIEHFNVSNENVL